MCEVYEANDTIEGLPMLPEMLPLLEEVELERYDETEQPEQQALGERDYPTQYREPQHIMLDEAEAVHIFEMTALDETEAEEAQHRNEPIDLDEVDEVQ